MAIRKDEVQISIKFLTDESKQYASLIESNKALVKDLKTATKNGGDLSKILKQIADNAATAAKIDLSKLTPSQLTQRAAQLNQQLKLIPQTAPQFAILQRELLGVNTQLATIRSTTRGIAPGMQAAAGATNVWTRTIQLAGAALSALGIVSILASLAQYAKQLFDVGSELEGLDQKTKTVFGEQEALVRGFAETNAEALGLARQDYVDLATGAADLLKPMGFTTEQAAKLSVELTNQSGILAAWSKGKIQTKEASEILNKALLGERDALNSLNIDVQQSLVDDRLKKEGLDNLTGASRRQAEAIITLQLITEQSTDANTDFSNSTQSLSKRKQELSAQISEVTQKIARFLIPLFNTVVEVGLGMFRSLSRVGSAFERLTGGIKIVEFLGAAFRVSLVPIVAFGEAIANIIETVSLIASGEFKQAFNKITSIGSDVQAGLIDALGTEKVRKQASEKGKQFGEAFGDNYLKGQLDSLRKNGERSNKGLEKQAKDALDAALKAAELAAGREELINDRRYQQKEISERQHAERILEIQKSLTASKLAILQGAGQGGGDKALDTEKDLLAAEIRKEKALADIQKRTNDAQLAAQKQADENRKSYIEASLADFEGQATSEENALRQKFANQLLAEQAFQEQLLNNEVSSKERQLQFLIEAGLRETEQFRKIEGEKLNAQIEINALRLENQKRTAEVEAQLQKASLDVTKDVFGAAIELLSTDEDARKKHADTIKAFEIATIGVNLASEIQAIWKTANANPSNILFPGSGNIIAGVKTGVAIARAGAQTAKIAKTKFAGGGFTGFGFGAPDETGHRPVGVVHEREWVSPRWMTEHPVLGQKIRALENIRQRGFADGGYATDPAFSELPGASGASGFDKFTQEMKETAKMFQDAARNIPRTVKADVVYTEFESTANRVNNVRNAAAI